MCVPNYVNLKAVQYVYHALHETLGTEVSTTVSLWFLALSRYNFGEQSK